jgi:hypothetical protein
VALPELIQQNYVVHSTENKNSLLLSKVEEDGKMVKIVTILLQAHFTACLICFIVL